jgi:hypothetical protein
MYDPEEMMVVAASRFLEVDDVVFIGIGLPSKAANLARKTHAPELSMIYESGTLDTKPTVLPLSIGDPELSRTAKAVVSVPEMFNYWLQGGWIRTGFLGAAQIDRFANLNSTVIGDYRAAPEPQDLCRKARFHDHGRNAGRGELASGPRSARAWSPGRNHRSRDPRAGRLQWRAGADPPPSWGLGRGRDRSHELAVAGRGQARRDRGTHGE